MATHKIKHGDYVNIIGNRRNIHSAIKVTIASQHEDEFFHSKPGQPEVAWIIPMPTIICSNPKLNFGKGSVESIDVNYDDIFDTPQGKFRLIEYPLSDGKLEKI